MRLNFGLRNAHCIPSPFIKTQQAHFYGRICALYHSSIFTVWKEGKKKKSYEIMRACLNSGFKK